MNKTGQHRFSAELQFGCREWQGTIATQAGHYERGIVPVGPLTSQSVVSLLSLSKPITNLLALKLIDDGHLALDERVSRYNTVGLTSGAASGWNDSERLARSLSRDTPAYGRICQNADLLGWKGAKLVRELHVFGLNCLSSDAGNLGRGHGPRRNAAAGKRTWRKICIPSLLMYSVRS